MKVVGCDPHARQQTLATMDTETGEYTEKMQERRFFPFGCHWSIRCPSLRKSGTIVSVTPTSKPLRATRPPFPKMTSAPRRNATRDLRREV
jgi:hypothetical protein